MNRGLLVSQLGLVALLATAHAGTMTLYTSSGKQYSYDLAKVGKVAFAKSAVVATQFKNETSPDLAIKATGTSITFSAPSGSDLLIQVRTIEGAMVHQFRTVIGKGGQSSVNLSKILVNGLYVVSAQNNAGQSNHILFQNVR